MGEGRGKGGGGERRERSKKENVGFKQRSSEGNDTVGGERKRGRNGKLENVLGRRRQKSIESVVRHTECGRAAEGGSRSDRMQDVGRKGRIGDRSPGWTTGTQAKRRRG